LCIPICCSRFSPGIGRGIAALPSRDGFRSWLRHTGAGSPMHLGRIEFNIVLFTDWSFASGCSPPILSFTQLPSATDRPVLLSDRDFHPTVGAYFQAHSYSPFAAACRLENVQTPEARSAWNHQENGPVPAT